MRNNDEKKRQKLINKLIFLNVYNKEDQQLLYKLPLSKLQYEYRRFNLQNHPHGEFGSIQFV
jgi:hypothetical protein